MGDSLRMCVRDSVSSLGAVCVHGGGDWRQCVPPGCGQYLLNWLLFIPSSSWLSNMETERPLAQKAELAWPGPVQYTVYHGECAVARTPCQPIHRQDDGGHRTISAGLLALNFVSTCLSLQSSPPKPPPFMWPNLSLLPIPH